MFTGVHDPGHQRAQSGKGDKTTASAVTVRARWLRPGDPLQKRNRFFGHFGPKGVTNKTEHQALQVTRLGGGLPCFGFV